MAISGGCCSGYIYVMRDGVLSIVRGETRLRSAFDKPGDAAAKLKRGEQAAVAGVDARALRELVTRKTVKGEVTK
jgi:hypothetical protein